MGPRGRGRSRRRGVVFDLSSVHRVRSFGCGRCPTSMDRLALPSYPPPDGGLGPGGRGGTGPPTPDAGGVLHRGRGVLSGSVGFACTPETARLGSGRVESVGGGGRPAARLGRRAAGEPRGRHARRVPACLGLKAAPRASSLSFPVRSSGGRAAVCPAGPPVPFDIPYNRPPPLLRADPKKTSRHPPAAARCTLGGSARGGYHEAGQAGPTAVVGRGRNGSRRPAEARGPSAQGGGNAAWKGRRSTRA